MVVEVLFNLFGKHLTICVAKNHLTIISNWNRYVFCHQKNSG